MRRNLACLFPHFFAKNARHKPIMPALFGFKLRKNPAQSYVPLVFRAAHNGIDDYPEQSEIKLSDAFIKAGLDTPALDLTVKILNINKGKNQLLLQKSKSLNDYETFTPKVREFQTEFKGNFDSQKALE